MKTHTLVTTKDLVIEGKEIKAGTTIARVVSDISYTRLVNGLQNGAVARLELPIDADPEAAEVSPASTEEEPTVAELAAEPAAEPIAASPPLVN